tara:strand:- start:281 stop:496 length:216 start_codon:yes stop_codon:yes gene_type:complete
MVRRNDDGLALKGKKSFEAKRKSHTYGKGRVCEEENCEVVMSQYNKATKCFVHAPVTFPRTRGLMNPSEKA